jgi:undecaprenyl-diphosphatase
LPTESLPAPLTETPAGRRFLPPEWRARIDAFDTAVETALDRVRGNPIVDRTFYAATELGDWSLIWHMIGAARGLTSDQRADEAFRLSAVLGAETVLVNGIIKSFFNRTRPDWEQHRAFRIRKPRSSSFPSGHASAAFTAAAVLSEDDPLWPLYYGVAVVVATSRVYVKIHHASDVVAGAALGMLLGRAARRAWPKPGTNRGTNAAG